MQKHTKKIPEFGFLNLILKSTILIFFLLLSSISATLASEWVYTVKPGDTLWRLTEDFLVDIRYWRRLQSMNYVTQPNNMPPGTTLRIPLKWTKINPSQAMVKNVAGKVTVISKDGKRDAKLETFLLVNDEITTDIGASITLEFGDGSVLTLREESKLRLETLEYYGNKDVFNTKLKLEQGRTDNEVNPHKKPGSRFEIYTPSATAAVRGTVYRVAAPDQTTTSTEVLEGKVTVANDLGQEQVPGGYGSVAKLNTPPTPPIVLLDAPDLSEVPELVEKLPIRFNLPEIENARSYRIQLAKNSAFQSLDYDGTSSTTTTRIPALADGNYLMKVRGIDKNNLEGFDSTHSFTLNAKPEAPFLVMPKLEAAIPVEHTAFSWSDSKDISTYHFQLADNDKLSQPVVDTITHDQGSNIELKETLTPGKWFWRVAAIDAADGPGPFGETNTFRVMKPGPAADTPEMSDTDIVFRWSAGAPSDQYAIQISREETFETLLVDTQTSKPNYTMLRPADPGKIYIRVRLIEADGFEGSWSTPHFLTIPEKTPYWLGVLPFLFLL